MLGKFSKLLFSYSESVFSIRCNGKWISDFLSFWKKS